MLFFYALGNLETSLIQITWYQFLAAISSKSVNSMEVRGLLFVVSEPCAPATIYNMKTFENSS